MTGQTSHPPMQGDREGPRYQATPFNPLHFSSSLYNSLGHSNNKSRHWCAGIIMFRVECIELSV